MSLRERVEPGVSRRKDFPLVSRKAALLIIDVQQYLMPITTMSSSSGDEETEEESKQERHYYTEQALPTMIQNIQKLAAAFRVIRDDPKGAEQNQQKSTAGCEVIFTYLQALTNDARDISLDYKLSGPALCNIPNATTPMGAIFLEELQPDPHKGKGDIMIPKTSCSVFQSTNLEYVLRNLNIEQLVIAGQLTDQCVESAVRDAADLGFLVTLAEDACAAKNLDAHLKGLHGAKGFCRILQTVDIMDEILEDLMKEQQKQAAGGGEDEDNETNGELTEAQVLAYLKERGMTKSADQLERQFNKKNASEIVRENIQHKSAERECKIAHKEQAVKLISKNLKQKACKRMESSSSSSRSREKWAGDENDRAAVEKVSGEQNRLSLSPHSSSSTKLLSILSSPLSPSPPPFPLGQQVVLTKAAIEKKAQELASTSLLSPPPSPPASAAPLVGQRALPIVQDSGSKPNRVIRRRSQGGQRALPIVQDSSSKPNRVTRRKSQGSLGSMAKSLLHASSDGEAGPLGQRALPIVQDFSSKPSRVTRKRSQGSLGSMAKSLLHASSDDEDSSISSSSSVDELDPVILVDSNHSRENLLDIGSNHTHRSHNSLGPYIRDDDEGDSSDSFASESEEDMAHKDFSLPQDRGRSCVNMRMELVAAGSTRSTDAILNGDRASAENATADTAIVETKNPILKAAFIMSGRCRSRSPEALSSLSPERETNSAMSTSACYTPNDANADHSVVVDKAIEAAIAEATADAQVEMATATLPLDAATPSAHNVMDDKDETESTKSSGSCNKQSHDPTDSGITATATTSLQAHISTIAISTVSKVVSAAASVAGVATDPGASAAPSDGSDPSPAPIAVSKEKNDTAEILTDPDTTLTADDTPTANDASACESNQDLLKSLHESDDLLRLWQ